MNTDRTYQMLLVLFFAQSCAFILGLGQLYGGDPTVQTARASTPELSRDIPDRSNLAECVIAQINYPRHILSYQLHITTIGDHLDAIAHQYGSEAALIQQYNHISCSPPPGRALIIPQTNPPAIWPQQSVRDQTILIDHGRTDRPWVALTIDMGAGSQPVPHMLEILRERDIQVTFFPTGNWIAQNPWLARQIAQDGHEFGNHSYSHPDLRTLTDRQIAQELAKTEQLLYDTTGATSRPFVRPPYGAYDERVLQTITTQGYLPIFWSLDSLDSVDPPKTPAFLIHRVTTTLSREELSGAIILIHGGSEATAEALPSILDQFATMGFEVRTLSEVLGQ
ncbi:MAG: polysaccharide deacetylase family protein [Chloroflexaceae bacterium]|nr:polysaccharide deacetylase family protein [Chloroflexaceae bacterium]